MIICHCNVISSSDIERAIERIWALDPDQEINPQFVFRECGKRPDCGNCLSQFVDTIRRLKADSVEPAPAPSLMDLVDQARTVATGSSQL